MSKIPVGLQTYTVRDECGKDFVGTLRKVAKMGYQGVELAGTHSLSGTEIMQIVRDGPDLSTMEQKWALPPYFSLQWYFENANSPFTGDR